VLDINSVDIGGYSGQPEFSAKISLTQFMADISQIQGNSFQKASCLGWFCVILKNHTWVSLILCTVRDSVNGNGISIFCRHFILLAGVPFVSNELIPEKKVQLHLLAEFYFIYCMHKIFTLKKC